MEQKPTEEKRKQPKETVKEMNEQEIRKSIKEAIPEPKTPPELFEKTMEMAKATDKRWAMEREASKGIAGPDPEPRVARSEEQPVLGNGQEPSSLPML